MAVRPRIRFALAAAMATSLFGCFARTSAPRPTVGIHRTVTAIVRDSLGAPQANVDVHWFGELDSAGTVDVRTGLTDAAGKAVEVLGEGRWRILAGPSSDSFVAGATFDVPGASRAAADTELVQLDLHTSSIVHGTVTLAGTTHYNGTIVAVDFFLPVTTTDSTGAYVIDDMPLGTWPLILEHFGYALDTLTIAATTPGSDLPQPAVQLKLASTSPAYSIQTSRSVRTVPAPLKRAR
jgi:hypothetical protein